MRALAAALASGSRDVARSVRRPALWAMPGWFDFVLSYRRTLLGPFWETVAMALWVAGLGVVFRYSLGQGDQNYFAYVGVGVVAWFYMSSVATSSAELFRSKDSLILSHRSPLYTYVLRHVVAGAARLLMHMPVLAAVLVLASRPGAADLATAALGLGAVLFASFWVSALLGLVGARIADTKHVLVLASRFLFFATPVFWRADSLGDRALLASANPFTHFIDVVRAPLLGEPASDIAWQVVTATNVVGAGVTLLLYGRHHRNVVFWL